MIKMIMEETLCDRARYYDLESEKCFVQNTNYISGIVSDQGKALKQK
jgi:transcription antitermination factor NusG